MRTRCVSLFPVLTGACKLTTHTVLGGQKITGADVREQNGMRNEALSDPANADIRLVLATQAIANVVKSSFGPSGLDKMMVDDIGVRCLETVFEQL